MATIELLPDWHQVNSPNAWLGTPIGTDRVVAVADVFGGTGTYITESDDTKTVQYAFEDSPGDIDVVSQIDVKAEVRHAAAGTSLDAQLNIDGVGQGVVNLILTTSWATHAFGAWAGAWNRASLETSFITFRSSNAGKGAGAWIATARLVPTYTTTGRATKNTRQTMNVAPGVGFMYDVQRRGGVYVARRRVA